jgi:hypothetical protein
VFVCVALADGRLQAEEAEKFAAEIGDASRYRDPLLKALLSDLGHPTEFRKSFDATTAIASAGPDAIDREIAGTKALLKAKLSDEEYHRLLFSLIGIGKQVADSAGEEKRGAAGLKKPVPGMSLQEGEALEVLAAKFGADLAAGQAAAEKL